MSFTTLTQREKVTIGNAMFEIMDKVKMAEKALRRIYNSNTDSSDDGTKETAYIIADMLNRCCLEYGFIVGEEMDETQYALDAMKRILNENAGGSADGQE